MAKDERSPRADVVDVLIAVGVPDAGTLAAHDVKRIASDRAKRAYRRIHASGNQLLSALLKLAGLVGFAGHGLLQRGRLRAVALQRSRLILAAPAEWPAGDES